MISITWQLKSCFGFDTFFATDVRRFGDGGIYIGNLRKPIDEVIPKLEQKLSEAAGREVVVWFMEEKTNDITKQVNELLDFIWHIYCTLLMYVGSEPYLEAYRSHFLH